MIDLYTFLRFAELHYSLLLLGVFILALFVGICFRVRSLKVIIPALCAFLLGMLIICRTSQTDYYIVMLGDEDDMKAETAFNALQRRLSDRLLARLIANGSKYPNERFYLVLMAAQRNTVLSNTIISTAPGFMRTNTYSRLGNRLSYPITFEDFARESKRAEPSTVTNTSLQSVSITLLMQEYSEGAAAYTKRDYDTAVARFTSVISGGLSSGATYYSRSAAYAGRGDLYNAMGDIDRSIALEPTNATAWRLKGYLDGLMNRYSNAIGDYTQSIALAPATAADALAYRGMCYAKEGDFGRGIADCKEAIRLDSGSVAGLNNLAWLLAVAPSAELRDGETAVKFASQACKATSWNNPNCLGTLAAAYAETSEFDLAISWQEKSISIGMASAELQKAHERLDLYKTGKAFRESAKR